MRLIRLAATILYIGYLVQVGLLMIYLPWSAAWSLLLLRLPLQLAAILDHPALRGAITAFGLLHLALVAVEFRLSGAATPTGQAAGHSIDEDAAPSHHPR